MTVTCAVLALLTTSAPTAELPPHPRLLLDAAGIARLKDRLEHQPWAKPLWAGIQKSAQAARAEACALPPRGGAYYHFYIDPVKGAPLSRGKEIGQWQWEHHAADGTVYRGDPANPKRDYDGYACLEIHLQRGKQVRDLGLAYRVTGERAYAEKARDILLAYADLYPKLPRRNHWGLPWPNSGRIATHMLSEALWLVPVVLGADLIWDTLSPDDRTRIADSVFRPCCRDILIPQDAGLHNRQVWKNTAVGLTGYLLGDAELIRHALDDPRFGHRALMRDGVGDSGFWKEGSWSYHFYTLQAVWPLLEAARHCGTDLYDARLKQLVDAPFRLASPSGVLPAFNDGSETSLDGHAAFCELAYARFREPAYLTLLAGKPRTSELALFFGVNELPSAPPVRREAGDFPVDGYSTLTAGDGPDATWVCLKYGPHGGGHGHPDKASFVLYSRGKAVAIDPGMAMYGAAIHDGWYKTTLRHNTLVVGERSQLPTTGKFLSRAGSVAVLVDAGPIAAGVRFRRAVALLDRDHLAVIDQVEAEREERLDLAFHPAGRWVGLPEGEPFSVPDKDGYRYLEDATTRTLTDGIDLRVEIAKGWEAVVSLAGNEPTTLITATGVGAWQASRVPTVLFRRTARRTVFVWGMSLIGKPMRLRVTGPTAVVAGTSDGQSHRLTVSDDTVKVELAR